MKNLREFAINCAEILSNLLENYLNSLWKISQNLQNYLLKHIDIYLFKDLTNFSDLLSVNPYHLHSPSTF